MQRVEAEPSGGDRIVIDIAGVLKDSGASLYKLAFTSRTVRITAITDPEKRALKMTGTCVNASLAFAGLFSGSILTMVIDLIIEETALTTAIIILLILLGLLLGASVAATRWFLRKQDSMLTDTEIKVPGRDFEE